MSMLLLFMLAVTDAQQVTFSTDDELTIVADWYPVEAEGRPVVICLPMYRNVRASYEPVVSSFHDAGLNVLSLDLRGHGESAPQLREKVEGRDPELFNAMSKDVKAAIAWLDSEGHVDPTRVGLLGASVGCSVAIRSAVEQPGPIRAVAVMTPGAKYLGVDTLQDAENWRGVPLRIYSSSEEAPRVEPVRNAFERFPFSSYVEYEGDGMHGTRLFGKADGVEEALAEYFSEQLDEAPNLRIPHFVEGDPRINSPGFVGDTLKVRHTDGDMWLTLMVYAIGDQFTLGAMINGEFKGDVRFLLGDRVIKTTMDSETKVENPIAVHVDGKPSDKLEGYRLQFRGYTWVTIEVPMQEEWWKEGMPLRLEFQGADRNVTLPDGDGTFRATLNAVPIRD